jgi:hypothetical protein
VAYIIAEPCIGTKHTACRCVSGELCPSGEEPHELGSLRGIGRMTVSGRPDRLETLHLGAKKRQRGVATGEQVRASSSGFVELVDFGCQDEIALRQTVNFVRPGRDLDSTPGERDVWVVPLLLC